MCGWRDECLMQVLVKSETSCKLAQRGLHELIVLMVMPPVHRSMANRRSPSIG
jgi:hypothetical protein